MTEIENIYVIRKDSSSSMNNFSVTEPVEQFLSKRSKSNEKLSIKKEFKNDEMENIFDRQTFSKSLKTPEEKLNFNFFNNDNLFAKSKNKTLEKINDGYENNNNINNSINSNSLRNNFSISTQRTSYSLNKMDNEKNSSFSSKTSLDKLLNIYNNNNNNNNNENEKTSFNSFEVNNNSNNNILNNNNLVFTKKTQKMLVNSSPQYNLMLYDKEILKIIYNFPKLAKEQFSCRELQNKISNNPNLINILYPNLIQYINELIIDPFGNYLVQSFLPNLTEVQTCEFLDEINDFNKICKDSHGTRVIQKLIDCNLKSQNIILRLLNLIKPIFPNLINDINACHIIKKLLALNQIYFTFYIYELIKYNFFQIATHKHGCCAIQNIISNGDKHLTEMLINHIIQNSSKLICHQYGNYLIIFILKLKNEFYIHQILNIIVLYFYEFATQKYSSTVLEKCFELCDENSKTILYQCLCNNDMLKKIILDQYGNFVIQKAIKMSNNNNIRNYLFQLIVPIINNIKKSKYGNHVYSKLCNEFPQLKNINNNINNNNNNCNNSNNN
jgi:hypothetical protein